ncbi:hypothetical protein ACET3Z_029190 [Daucus carota]
MACASEANNSHHIRSISLPSRSHPNIVEVDEELRKLKTRDVSSSCNASAVSSDLLTLEGLYRCIADLLNLQLTQQALSNHRQEKWVDELLDGSVRLLDICGTTRDFTSQIKEHVVDLQSAIRRKKGDLTLATSISKFNSFRRKMKKQARKLIADLKQVDIKITCSAIFDLDYHLSEVIRVLKEVSSVSISVFQSLLLFFSSPVSKSKSTKWSLVSKLIQKGTVTCEEQLENKNELEKVDSALDSYDSCESEKIEIAQERLKALHDSIELIESAIECMSRRLIRTRASFLNIISSL